MQQLKNEDKFCGESTQRQPDLEALLQDDDAFENVFFPSTYMDYNPANLNEIIDFDELQAILDEGTHPVVENGGGSSGSLATDHINNDELMKAKSKLNSKRVIRKWNARKRIQEGTSEDYEKKELQKIKNREAAARAFEENKAYVKWLELEVQKYRKKNADLKRSLLFAESSISLDMSRKQLRRTSSGLL
ncbi:hypothetical protein V6N13_045380 [Hibiscus sabdariffa]|uniref:BZIP domain-containing protein n=1 Tax=Hibiscus sabdariffa TaxID=183260 RepID=A0ABR2RKT2_9ROSI